MMFSGGQMMQLFRHVVECHGSDGASISYLVARTGTDSVVWAMGGWFQGHHPPRAANNNWSRR